MEGVSALVLCQFYCFTSKLYRLWGNYFQYQFFYYSSTLLSPWLLAQYSPSNKNKITMVISRQHFDSRGEPQAITYYLILQLAIKTSPSTSFRFKIKVKLPQNHCTCDDIYAKLSEYIFRNERKRNLLVYTQLTSKFFLPFFAIISMIKAKLPYAKPWPAWSSTLTAQPAKRDKRGCDVRRFWVCTVCRRRCRHDL